MIAITGLEISGKARNDTGGHSTPPFICLVVWSGERYFSWYVIRKCESNDFGSADTQKREPIVISL